MIEYGLVGKSISYSNSKLVHEKFGGYSYELISLASEAEFIEFIKARQFHGLNITIPYKETIIHLLDKLDERAARIGAVNTVVNNNGVLTGYNTDYDGFDYTLEYRNIDVVGKKVLILGAGGASKAVCAVLADRGVGEVILTGRQAREGVITLEQAAQAHADAAVIINATPIGTYPNLTAKPITLADFPACGAVVDLIYNPLCTELMLEAEERKIKAVSGLDMFAKQAEKAAEHFGEGFDTSPIDIIEWVIAQKRNIALIGMPSSGKTTIGKLLAAKLGKSFVDTDDIIVEAAKRPIKDIFANYGETHFRALEHDAVQQASLLTGHIIATGGGVVKDERNINWLRHNCLLIFLHRSLEHLISSDVERPLSSSQEAVQKLYKERNHLYCAYADIIVNNWHSIENTLDDIMDRLSYWEMLRRHHRNI